MKLPKQKQQHLILVGLVTVVACVGLWFAFVEHQKRRMEILDGKIRETEARVLNMKNLIRAEDRITASLEVAERKLSDIEATFADGDLYSWFLLKQREFQSAYSVETPQISREVAGPVNLFPRFPYRQATYTVRGSAFYHDMGKFIAGFENQFPYFRILNLELEPDPGAGPSDPEKLGFKIEISTLVKPSPTLAN